MVPKVLYSKYFVAVFCVLSVVAFALIGSINNSERVLAKAEIRIKEVNSDETLFGLLSEIGPGPTLLVLYTSWCSNCVEKMPSVIAAIDAYRKIKPVIVSLDTNRGKLASFLLNQRTVNFVPYNVSAEYHGKLAYALTGKGLHFTGKIPFIAVLGNNTIPITHITSDRALAAAIEHVISGGRNDRR
ncbi:thioredoxin-like domain-containing protein [Candidatus Anaplasma sp. TIGMIC]|nr:thioredoxin-like domain-containing protein [Candidatus Anaplasma sp. TIGMIC]